MEILCVGARLTTALVELLCEIKAERYKSISASYIAVSNKGCQVTVGKRFIKCREEKMGGDHKDDIKSWS